ncbi:MAG: hypothetical protein GPJ51_04585 [Candidatus Heimdallarchaeota archaeon]|nr:hypothetical protein [Candidatus Heimdallarchaeota archaeon]
MRDATTRIKPIFLILLIFLSSIFITYSVSSNQNGIKTTQIHQTETFNFDSLVSSGPILISSDDNFTDYGFSGLGTPEEPYLIENLDINTSSSVGISINSTSKSFIIRNCQIDAEKIGIWIISIVQGTAQIVNNIVKNNNATGISLLDYYPRVPAPENMTGEEPLLDDKYVAKISANVVSNNTYGIHIAIGIIGNNSAVLIEKNTCEFNQHRAIELIASGSVIRENQINFNAGGMHLFGSNLTISNNICSNNDFGMIISADFSEISNNYCANNEIGIGINSYHSIFSNNTCTKNSLYGFEIYKASSYINITYNEISENLYGIKAIGYFVTYNYNIFERNTLYAILLNLTIIFETQEYHAYKHIIHHNDFIKNNKNGKSQAFDEGFNTTWYDKTTLEGNYWDDLRRRAEYPLDGPFNTIDPYPLKNPAVYVKTSFSTFWILLVALVIPIFVRRKLKN